METTKISYQENLPRCQINTISLCGFIVSILWPRRPCYCDRIHHHSHKYLYPLSSTWEQKPIVKKQHIYERRTHETKMADQSLMRSTNSYPGSLLFGQKVRLSVLLNLPSSNLQTTEHSWTKTMLSRGGSRKLFNSSLMNKLIRIEWVSAIRVPSMLMDVTSSMSKNDKFDTLFKTKFPKNIPWLAARPH